LNYDPYISPKADIFAIGMLLLEMVTLEPMIGYYDYSHAAIDYDSLIHRLSRISHSLPLKTLLAEMLEYDPEERIGLVSLKEKIHRLQHPQAEQTQIARSKSSKMLKEILSQSRKSGSLSRQGENSAALSRQPSTERKNTSRIELHCNSGKKLDLKDIESKEQSMKKEEKDRKE
jgi:serine/threonine protein kinase